MPLAYLSLATVFALSASIQSASGAPHGGAGTQHVLAAARCSVSSLPVRLSADVRVSTYTVTATCPAGVPYTLRLTSPRGCSATRTASDGVQNLAYAILTPDRSGAWCDGTNGTRVVQGVGSGLPQRFDGVIVLQTATAHAGTFIDRIDGAIEAGQ